MLDPENHPERLKRENRFHFDIQHYPKHESMRIFFPKVRSNSERLLKFGCEMDRRETVLSTEEVYHRRYRSACGQGSAAF